MRNPVKTEISSNDVCVFNTFNASNAYESTDLRCKSIDCSVRRRSLKKKIYRVRNFIYFVFREREKYFLSPNIRS